MAVRSLPSYRDVITAHVLTELAVAKARAASALTFQVDMCDWAQENFYIAATAKPIVFLPHQIAVNRYMWTRREDHKFPAQTLVYSAIKKSGKSTVAGVALRYMGETQVKYGECFAVGNDQEQAKMRSFREVRQSLEMTPGYNKQRETLPGRWKLQKLSFDCLLTGTQLRAVAVDAKGEAGGKQALSVWTELWGAEYEDALRFWDELTPVPTEPDSLRMVETYAGYDGESSLLRGLYDKGREGHQLTAGELALFAMRPGKAGETFEDLVNGWHEAHGNPDALVPVWHNEQAGIIMYWDDGLNARRMPWQVGEEGDKYYREQEATLPGPAFRRMHYNEWVGAESQFVPMESWDACGHEHKNKEWEPVALLLDGERTPIIAGVDAAVTGDCFGIVAVSRCPHDPASVDIRALKKWDPKDSGGVIDYDGPEAFLRAAAAVNNLIQIAYDPYQLENMMQKLRKDGVTWCEPFIQMGERLKADRQLYDMIIQRRIHYSHDDNCLGGHACTCWLAPMREHIANANAKIQKDEDSKMRIVKKPSGRKIDLAVSLSMASARCLYLIF